jgi:hypothetical protein
VIQPGLQETVSQLLHFLFHAGLLKAATMKVCTPVYTAGQVLSKLQGSSLHPLIVFTG